MSTPQGHEWPGDDLAAELRRYADTAEAGDRLHWATAMRRAADALEWPILHAMNCYGADYSDLSICGECKGTGYRA
jgi:hypothetical protein